MQQNVAELVRPALYGGVPERLAAIAHLIPGAAPGLVDPDVQIAFLRNSLKVKAVRAPVRNRAGSVRVHHDQGVRIGLLGLAHQNRNTLGRRPDQLRGGSHRTPRTASLVGDGKADIVSQQDGVEADRLRKAAPLCGIGFADRHALCYPVRQPAQGGRVGVQRRVRIEMAAQRGEGLRVPLSPRHPFAIGAGASGVEHPNLEVVDAVSRGLCLQGRRQLLEIGVSPRVVRTPLVSSRAGVREARLPLLLTLFGSAGKGCGLGDPAIHRLFQAVACARRHRYLLLQIARPLHHRSNGPGDVQNDATIA